MQRKADAKWTGDLRTGTGTIKLGSGVFEGPYSFKSRFEDGKDTNPEELVGAAHAACFSMALSASLAKAGHKPTSVATTATVNLELVGAGSQITRIDLATHGIVPGLSEAEFTTFAEDAKANCIVSKALASVPMTLSVTFAGA
ncbi:MAG: OsmC family protein [Gemmatimonadota bacterium]|jgi:osmotically inducible protein OsmC|nr:OsmC family protein [Gemmatimonadota bacterium]